MTDGLLIFPAYFWIALSIAIGMVGSAKGRGGFSYFIGSLLFSPLVVGVVALGVPPKPDQVMPSEAVKQGSMREGVLALIALTMVVGVGVGMALFLNQGAV